MLRQPNSIYERGKSHLIFKIKVGVRVYVRGARMRALGVYVYVGECVYVRARVCVRVPSTCTIITKSLEYD